MEHTDQELTGTEDLDEQVEETPVKDLLPPSVKASEPILSSYLFSTALRGNVGPDEEELRRTNWIMGIDEAGRGPVLGPMVYGAAFCTQKFAETKLSGLGFADSKTLTHKRRQELLESIVNPSSLSQIEERVEWNVKVLTPADISQGMNRRSPYNLNAQAFDATCQIIQSALDQGYNLHHIFVDTLGPPKTHQSKLENAFSTIKFTVCSKADSIYPIVGAASIVAKVTRDAIISNWIHPEDFKKTLKRKLNEDDPVNPISLPLGSGYPADPNTVNWLNKNFDQIFGFGQLVRFSWGTVKSMISDRGIPIKWNDEPAKIDKYFITSSSNGSRKATTSTPLSKDLGLMPISSL